MEKNVCQYIIQLLLFWSIQTYLTRISLAFSISSTHHNSRYAHQTSPRQKHPYTFLIAYHGNLHLLHTWVEGTRYFGGGRWRRNRKRGSATILVMLSCILLLFFLGVTRKNERGKESVCGVDRYRNREVIYSGYPYRVRKRERSLLRGLKENVNYLMGNSPRKSLSCRPHSPRIRRYLECVRHSQLSYTYPHTHCWLWLAQGPSASQMVGDRLVGGKKRKRGKRELMSEILVRRYVLKCFVYILSHVRTVFSKYK